jgi:hypothetical protein
MPTDMSRAELWAENIEFYKELGTKYHFQQEPMIALFPKLDEAGFFEKYYPSNSHESLGMSTEREFNLRLVKPMIYLTYLPKDGSFVVTFQQGHGNTVDEENVGPMISPEVLAKIDAWLSADVMFDR